ncbi:putative DNA polymerase III epsilon subunit [Actinacidiphila reveromycinica]|uniref:Putative DNA polymerase III epsilon subunit n=1 Tax=Actinacidiphila reveromycinica TaxID=659352 RepID=A0A7U3VRQ7_9ACTN|nr:exonuclease domain-containing protein [Streptomyces sp. SN-593]BBB01024.1 putative DNA polymerase III epsilon subunit [Streptomyces sp. SN-593]
MSWHKRPALAFDTETTGINIESDRIVSAAAIHVSSAGAKAATWLANPGVEIPEAATAVHHITTEHARAHGHPAKDVIEDVVHVIGEAVHDGVPIAGHNVVYDLSILDREARRHLGCGLDGAFDLTRIRVIDTSVLDKHVLPRRRRVSEKQGARQLITLAQVYSLGWDEGAAHGSEYDALMAARIAYRIGSLIEMPAVKRPEFEFGEFQQFDQLRGLDIDALHDRQRALAVEQAAGLESYFRQKDPNAVVDGRWPLIPFTTEGTSR